ncbi:MAG TPA: PGF-pre-PGF domain-containing protein [Halobacteriales archaeon]|nr:PGF-pre-PGF domain-containing protein [Halobacteriales archaeon]
MVSVSVKGARAGDRLDLDVSPSEAEDEAVAFEGISVTVKDGGDFTMQVTNSRERLPGSPAFEPEQAADSLGRIRLDHSITNEEVEEVSYTFRVSKAHLEGTDTDPEDVSLFRYADDEWSELPTDVVGETEGYYVLESLSPGMSEFSVGAKRPDFDTFWADVDAGSVDAGETVTVRGRVTNDGGADGVYDARLVVDGETVATRSITIAAGGTRQINFRTELDRPGDRRISINRVSAGDVSVEEQSDESRTEASEPTLTIVIDRLLDVSHALGITAPPSSNG